MKIRQFASTAIIVGLGLPGTAQAQTSVTAEEAEAAADAVAAAEAELREADAAAEAAAVEIYFAIPGDHDPYGPRLTNHRDVFRHADYPAEAWRQGLEGTVGYEVDVSAEGLPLGCMVTESSGSTLLDQTVCPLVMERAQFEPAIDEGQNPIAGTFEHSYRWRKREPEFPGTATIAMSMLVGADGMPSDCQVLEVSGAVPDNFLANDQPCPTYTRAPYRDAEGNPVATRVTIRFEVLVEPEPVTP